MTAPQLPTQTVLFTLGRYQVLKKLGEGGMGEVFLAFDTQLQREVALKILPAASVHDAQAVARFQREARALAHLSHPGIVKAFDSDQVEGKQFLVMEYLQGASLQQLLAEKGKLSPGRAADYVHQAALALQHAHEQGLVHRDIKPSNLFLAGGGQVKLLDLGLARFLQDHVADGTLTSDGVGMGTLDYVSPEQLQSAHRVDHRADIYSLGCTLYHLLTGQVPYPGTSRSEKYEGHFKRQPQALGDFAPDVPQGLALIVQKMMAKSPAARHQSAGAVAEALAPYVASQSHSAMILRSTATFGRGSPTMTATELMAAQRRWLITGVAASVVVLAVGVGLGLWFAPPPSSPPEPGPGTIAQQGNLLPPEPRKTESKASLPEQKKTTAVQAEPKKPEPPKVIIEPGVLTVAKNGTGQFDTINKALEKVKPGETIRVLDDAEYVEQVLLQRESAQRDITIEAWRGATLVAPAGASKILGISAVRGVTVRGFRLRPHSEMKNDIAIHAQSAGTVLEDLDLLPASGRQSRGISLEHLDLAENDPPVVVRRCHIREGRVQGIAVSGVSDDGRLATPCRNIVLRDNQIQGCLVGVMLRGQLQRIQVVGNRISDAELAGLGIGDLIEPSRDVVLANNTNLNSSYGLLVMGTGVKGQGFHLCNNLLLGSKKADAAFFHGKATTSPAGGAGDGAGLLKAWRFAGNCREGPPLKGIKDGRLPLAEGDQLSDKVEVLSRQPGSPGFLQPGTSSLLASKGAGQTDPSLPGYIGAVAPEGTLPWDWTRTWLAPIPGQLLTVSAQESDGGKYRTIGEALVEANRWATIRVLDDARYAERILLDDANRFAGLQLEAPRGATLYLKDRAPFIVSIRGVPHVRLRGFRLDGPKGPLPGQAGFSPRLGVNVQGEALGLVLERLTLQLHDAFGLVFNGFHTGDQPYPGVVRHCLFQRQFDGLSVFVVKGARPCQAGLHIYANRFKGTVRGLYVMGEPQRLRLCGNLVTEGSQAGLQLEGLTARASNLLLANNTICDCDVNFRVWQGQPGTEITPGQVRIQRNLLAAGSRADCAVYRDRGPQVAGDLSSELSEQVASRWVFAQNGRDSSGTLGGQLPLAASDRTIDAVRFRSQKVDDPGFLAVGGSPKWLSIEDNECPWLPPWVGAMPPESIEPWDWNRTFDWLRRPVEAETK